MVCQDCGHLEHHLCAKPWHMLQSQVAAMPQLWVPLKISSLPLLSLDASFSCSSCGAFGGGTEWVGGYWTVKELRKTGKWEGSPWGWLSHRAASAATLHASSKEIICEAFDSPLPTFFWAFLCFSICIGKKSLNTPLGRTWFCVLRTTRS